jgi:uncharacterized protein YqeY
MMSATLTDIVNDDIKAAMKAGEKDKLEAYRYLKSLLIQNRTAVKSIDEMDVLIAYVKKLSDSIAMYPEGHEARTKISREVEVLSKYMPKPLSEDEVSALIKAILAKTPDAKMGLVMKELTPLVKGRFDGKKANDMVKAALG